MEGGAPPADQSRPCPAKAKMVKRAAEGSSSDMETEVAGAPVPNAAWEAENAKLKKEVAKLQHMIRDLQQLQATGVLTAGKKGAAAPKVAAATTSAAKVPPTVDADGFKTVTGKRTRAHQATPQQVQVNNQFEGLEEEDVEAVNVPLPKKPHVPPVYAQATLKQVNELLLANAQLKEKGAFILARVAGNRVTIKGSTPENRRIAMTILKEGSVEHFSFTPKDEKPFKAVLFGLEGFTEAEVKEELLATEELLVKPTDVKVMKRFSTAKMAKEDLPLYTVSFPTGTKMAQLKGLKSLFNVRCGFRMLRPSTAPLQCYRCQEYGHTSQNCTMKSRCVKCALDHEDLPCPAITADSPKALLRCALCNQFGHPASFRGCPKAIEYAQRMAKAKTGQQNSGRGAPRGEQRTPHRTDAAATRTTSAAAAAKGGRRAQVPTPVDQQPALAGAWRAEAPRAAAGDQQSNELAEILAILRGMKSEVASLKDDMIDMRQVTANMAFMYGEKLGMTDVEVDQIFG